jgi:hypothetical protein
VQREGVPQCLLQLGRDPLRLLDQHLLRGVKHRVACAAERLDRSRALGGQRVVGRLRGGEFLGRDATGALALGEVRRHVQRRRLSTILGNGPVGVGPVRGDLALHVAERVER